MKTNKILQIRESDLRKIKKEATQDAVNRALHLAMFCLYDKHGFDINMLIALSQQMDELADDITDQRISWKDIETAMLDELGVSVIRRIG